MIHLPVLQKEVLNFFEPEPNKNFIDCTVGNGGHAISILKATAPAGKILGIDWDREMIKSLRLAIQSTEFQSRLILVCDNYANLKEIIEKNNFGPIHGILFDLGLSSWHLEKSERGFSFQGDEPLDMRYNPEASEIKARDILNYWPEDKLAKIFEEYGEERFSQKIAKKIIEQRKINQIKSTFQLLKIIRMAVPNWYCHRKKHFATRTFQALRIAINFELENLKQALPRALDVLEPNGRLVVISFHSLEDRIVKFFFREKGKEGLVKILTKKPVRPTPGEIKLNPRARSAKLRAALKIGEPRPEGRAMQKL